MDVNACFLLKLRYYFFEIVQSKPYSSRAADFIIPAQICEYGYRLLSFIQRKYHCINLDPLFLHNRLLYRLFYKWNVFINTSLTLNF